VGKVLLFHAAGLDGLLRQCKSCAGPQLDPGGSLFDGSLGYFFRCGWTGSVRRPQIRTMPDREGPIIIFDALCAPRSPNARFMFDESEPELDSVS